MASALAAQDYTVIVMNIAIAIFAKTAGLSAIKTRLAADIGKADAEAFYALSVSCVETMVGTAVEKCPVDLTPYWALAEAEGPNQFSRRDFIARWTGEGGLGTRLWRVSQELLKDHDGVILIGTDSPQLDCKHILDAVFEMTKNREGCVIGPARDGGFYLFGSLRPVSKEVWEAVSYSTETTRNDLVARLKSKGQEAVFLSVEQDVDVVSDLKELENALVERKSELSVSQLRLLEWLQVQHSSL